MGLTPWILPAADFTYSTALIYRELARDAAVVVGGGATADEASTTGHELLHSFAACHFTGNAAIETDDDIMTDDYPFPAGKQKLNDKHINLVRTVKMPNLSALHGTDCEVN